MRSLARLNKPRRLSSRSGRFPSQPEGHLWPSEPLSWEGIPTDDTKSITGC